MTEDSLLTAGIVAAYFSNPAHTADTGQLITVLRGVKDVVSELSEGRPSVTSLSALRGTKGKGETVTCLECGVPWKMLKRHLQAEHDLTPDEYREKYHLAADAPMVAPKYAELRSNLAKASGLGKRLEKKISRRRR